MKNSKLIPIFVLSLMSSFAARSAEPIEEKKAPNLLETTNWITEFAPTRMVYSSMDVGAFSAIAPGFHETYLIESLTFNGCDTSIKKLQQNLLVRDDYVERGGANLIPRKNTLFVYSFNLKGTQASLDRGEVDGKQKGYQLLRIRFNPNCEKTGGCPRFLIKEYDGEAEIKNLKNARSVDGGIYFEVSMKNANELTRVVSAFNHAATICTSLGKSSLF